MQTMNGISASIASMMASAAPAGGDGLAREFAARWPLVPLFHRAVRVHYRADVRGVALLPAAIVRWDELFFSGEPEPMR